MFKGHTVRVNTYFAFLIITLFGAGAAFFIMSVADGVTQSADAFASSYEVPADSSLETTK